MRIEPNIWNSDGTWLNIKIANIDAVTGSSKPIISICCGFTLPEDMTIEVWPIRVGNKIKPDKERIDVSLIFPNPWIKNSGNVNIDEER